LLVDTSSTDDWATTANQTKNTGWTDGGVADQIDAYFATKKADGTLDHVFTTNRLKDDGDTNLWKVDGTADKYTDDGTHPSEAGHVLYAQDALDGIREFNVIVNGATEYDPASDSSTVGWYDMSDAASVNLQAVTNFVESADNQRSGGAALGAINVTTPTMGFTYDTANDRGVLTGSEDDILIASALPHFFAVIEADSSFDESAAIGRPFAHEPTTGDDMTVRLGPFSGSLTDEVMGVAYPTYAAGATSANVSGVTSGNKFIIGVSCTSGSDPLLFLNTTASQTDDTVGDNTDPTIGTGDLRIGSGISGFGNFVGKIYELIVLDGAPTAQEAADIVDYLAAAHSVTVS